MKKWVTKETNDRHSKKDARHGKKYNIIYADPPWKYDRQKGEGVAAARYQTMSIAEIKSIPVNRIAASDAVLFLWVTFPKLKEGFRLLKVGDLSIRPVPLTGLNRTQRLTHFLLGLDFGQGVVRKFVCWQQKDILTGHPLM